MANKEYYRLSVYLDPQKEEQQQLIDLLESVQKKKSALLGLLAKVFLNTYGGTNVTNTDNLKVYIQHPELLDGSLVAAGRIPITQTVATATVPEPVTSPQAERNETVMNNTPDYESENQSLLEENATNILSALSSFSM